MATLTAPDGIRLSYEIDGEGPGLLLHLGAGCDASLWRAAGYLDPLARKYRCVLFDHRGHGASDHPVDAASNHIDRYADDVAALADSLALPSLAFFGWSNGVVVGLKAAQDHPGIFDALVLFGPIARRATPEAVAESAGRAAEGLRSKGWWLLLEQMLPAEPDPVPQWMIDRILATDIEPFIGWAQARPSWNWSAWDALPEISVPTLIVVGELEDPEDVMGEAASLMPNATRVRIPNREHINAFLDSAAVLPHVTAFLDRAL